MSTHRPTRIRIASLVALVTVVLGLTVAPAVAHEGQELDAVTVLARVDGRIEGLPLERGAANVDLRAVSGRELHIVDLGSTEAPATAIDFQLNAEQDLRLEVLDLEGNVVRTLAQGTWARGTHQLAWHHDSEAGESLDTGLYVVRLLHTVERGPVLTAR